MTRTRKLDAVEKAEAAGQVADSLAVRAELMRQVKAGETTLQQAQAKLKAIKRSAKCQGKVTRAQAFSRG